VAAQSTDGDRAVFGGSASVPVVDVTLWPVTADDLGWLERFLVPPDTSYDDFGFRRRGLCERFAADGLLGRLRTDPA
jgi:hypothetical protein